MWSLEQRVWLHGCNIRSLCTMLQKRLMTRLVHLRRS
ncbi:hypothetical protein O9992_05150 [Vibrio lentus]|nr:hypothetical protein [Vibrio lentus]